VIRNPEFKITILLF